MEQKQYQPQQISGFLASELDQGFTGVLFLETQVTSWKKQKSCMLAIGKGAIIYGGEIISTPIELAQMLGAKLNSGLINAAISMAKRKINNPNSFRELIELLIKFQVFSWKQVETTIESQIISDLEKLTPYPGQAKWNLSKNFDLSYGQDNHLLDWSKIKQELNRRQQEWQQLAPQIPGMDAIPHIASQDLEQITEPLVKKHLQKYVDGKNTLIDIAEQMNKEPLKVAQSYCKWVNEGWVNFGNRNSDGILSRGLLDREQTETPVSDSHQSLGQSVAAIATKTATTAPVKAKTTHLPIVLSVDDSPIVQLSIKRALQQHYQVILATKATEALEILNKKQVNLLLLDLTMPDVDGLDFCKTIRQMPKFRNLPIVMVTARDGLIDKMKGQIAGTNKYLTKPFQPEELLKVVSDYINAH